MSKDAKNKPAFRMGYYRKVHPQDKGRWADLGAAWTSKDGRGLNICFSSKPLDGQWNGWIYLRPVEESSEVEETEVETSEAA